MNGMRGTVTVDFTSEREYEFRSVSRKTLTGRLTGWCGKRGW